MVEGLYVYKTRTLLQMGSRVVSTRDTKIRKAGILEERRLLGVGWTKVSYKQLVMWDE